jgi:transcription elongation factor Elf1
MSLQLDQQYILQVGRRLNRFGAKGSRAYNFRCNICGDSHQDQSKKRGYFYVNKKRTGYSFVCHNCGGLHGEACSFQSWLKDFDHNLYEEYIFESMRGIKRNDFIDEKPEPKDDDDEFLDIVSKPQFKKVKHDEDESIYVEDPTEGNESNDDCETHIEYVSTSPFANRAKSGHSEIALEIPDLSDFEDDFSNVRRPKMGDLRKICDLPLTHGARKYLEKRKIPERFYDKMYLVWKFYTWCNEWKPDSFKPFMVENFEEPRLIIPFYDKDGQLMMIQGRSFSKDAKIRYFSIKCDDDFPKIYGLERIDFNKIVQVWEGPLDSLFGVNAVAMAGADANPASYFDDYVLIYDNEPRNVDICKRMQRAIDNGEKIVIWPKSIPEKYDGNDMILKLGLTEFQLNEIIRNNTYYGMEANLEFGKWKRCTSERRTTRNRDKYSNLGI